MPRPQALDLARDLDALETPGRARPRRRPAHVRLGPAGAGDGPARRRGRRAPARGPRRGPTAWASQVWGCLHERALPGWFAVDEHGLADDRSRRYFWARHVEQIGEDLGDLVDGWIPMLEPNRLGAPGLADRDGRARAPRRCRGLRRRARGRAARLRSRPRSACAGRAGRWRRATGWSRRSPPGSRPDVPPSPDAEVMAAHGRRGAVRVLAAPAARGDARGARAGPRSRCPAPAPRSTGSASPSATRSRSAATARCSPTPSSSRPAPTARSPGPRAWPSRCTTSPSPSASSRCTSSGTAPGPTIRRSTSTSTRPRAILQGALDDGIDLRGAWWEPEVDRAAGAPPARPGVSTAIGRRRRPALAVGA